MWQTAGRLQLNPDPFTLRELDDMDAARRTAAYDVAAWLGHIIANCHRSKNQPPYTPAQLHPDTAGRPAVRLHRLNRANFASFRRYLLGPAAAQPSRAAIAPVRAPAVRRP